MCMTGEGVTLLNFSNFNTMFNTGERSEPENNNKNKIKISGEGPDPRSPPLWIQACKIHSIQLLCSDNYMYNKIAELLGCKLSNLAHVQQNAHHLP